MFHEPYDISSSSFYGIQNKPTEFSISLTEDFGHTHAKPTHNGFHLVISLKEYFINFLYCEKILS